MEGDSTKPTDNLFQLKHLHNKSIFFLGLYGILCISVFVHCLLSFHKASDTSHFKSLVDICVCYYAPPADSQFPPGKILVCLENVCIIHREGRFSSYAYLNIKTTRLSKRIYESYSWSIIGLERWSVAQHGANPGLSQKKINCYKTEVNPRALTTSCTKPMVFVEEKSLA